MKKFLHKIVAILPLGQVAYARLGEWRERFRKNRDRKILQKYGPELLKLVHDRLAGKVEYFLDYGSLLGYVREGAFLKHDDDVDFSVMPGTDPRLLIEAFDGTEMEYFSAYSYHDEIREIGYKFRKMRVDFFFKGYDGFDFTADEYYAIEGVCYAPKETSCFRFVQPAVESIKTVEFLGVQTNIPTNAEDLLSAHYGTNWRNPDPSWKSTEGSGHYCRRQMPGFGRFGIARCEIMDIKESAK